MIMIMLHFRLGNTYCLCLIPCEISFLNHNRRDSKMEKIKTLQIFFSLLDNVIFWSAFERMTIFHATDFLTPNKFLWKYCEIHFIYLFFSKVIFHMISKFAILIKKNMGTWNSTYLWINPVFLDFQMSKKR